MGTYRAVHPTLPYSCNGFQRRSRAPHGARLPDLEIERRSHSLTPWNPSVDEFHSLKLTMRGRKFTFVVPRGHKSENKKSLIVYEAERNPKIYVHIRKERNVLFHFHYSVDSTEQKE